MTSKRSDTVDYTTQCTVLITFLDGNRQDRIVYERPQWRLPDRPLTAFDRLPPTDDQLTAEAHAIFADMKQNKRIGASSTLVSIFVARTAAASLEMNL